MNDPSDRLLSSMRISGDNSDNNEAAALDVAPG